MSDPRPPMVPSNTANSASDANGPTGQRRIPGKKAATSRPINPAAPTRPRGSHSFSVWLGRSRGASYSARTVANRCQLCPVTGRTNCAIFMP